MLPYRAGQASPAGHAEPLAMHGRFSDGRPGCRNRRPSENSCLASSWPVLAGALCASCFSTGTLKDFPEAACPGARVQQLTKQEVQVVFAPLCRQGVRAREDLVHRAARASQSCDLRGLSPRACDFHQTHAPRADAAMGQSSAGTRRSRCGFQARSRLRSEGTELSAWAALLLASRACLLGLPHGMDMCPRLAHMGIGRVARDSW